MQSLGLYTAQSQATGAVQGLFDVTGSSGVSTALSSLYTAFSSWSTSPDTPATGQGVLSAAAGLASSINDLSASLQQTASQIGQQADSTVNQINNIAKADPPVQRHPRICDRNGRCRGARKHNCSQSSGLWRTWLISRP